MESALGNKLMELARTAVAFCSRLIGKPLKHLFNSAALFALIFIDGHADETSSTRNRVNTV